LFSALTEESDPEDRWTVFTFPVDFDAALLGAKIPKDFNYILRKLYPKGSLKIKR
jgi:hypothetical protein